MNDLIRLYKIENSLEVFNDIIELFNKSETHDGLSAMGYNTSIKNSKDFKIPSEKGNYNTNCKYYKEWINIDNILHSMISPLISQYIDDINNTLDNVDIDDCKWKYIHERELNDTGHQIQKYIKNKGHYKNPHNDFCILPNTSYYRVFAYIMYLNTIEEGGETVFHGNYKIKPTSGTVVIFPASWTYPHCGNIPISDDKYIITGWIYAIDRVSMNHV